MAAVKNLHLEHLEDEIINNGIDGGRAAINFLRSLRDMMKGTSKKKVNMTVKWDGAPAIWAGKHPETGQFFVAKKSLFTKAQLYYTSEQAIKDASELSGDLEKKFIESFKYLSKLSWNDKILQGDLMFTDSDKKMEEIDGVNYVTFQPNTILYAADIESDLGAAIANAKYGIVFHTTYEGATIEDLGASFGADISTLGHSKDIWIDDATYKSVAGNSTLTAKDTVDLTKALSETGKSFHKIKKPSLTKFMKVQKAIQTKGAGGTYKTYMNAQIRKGKFNLSYKAYLSHFDKYWEDKVVGKVKMEKTKETKRKIGKQLRREITGLKVLITALTAFQTNMVGAKSLIIKGLNTIKDIGTFKKTSSGFETVNPEGYVAIDDSGKAVKLVDRMEFSLNNFTVAKNWDK
tara:strand:- start:3446 stop:4657 length:1212 start_codon:yes stop_codon:yes gene_type:complete